MLDERAIRARSRTYQFKWRADRDGTAPKGTRWADVPRGVVRDAAGYNCTRVFRWPADGRAWRVALGVTAGPGAVKYTCPDLDAAEALAEILVDYGMPCAICRRRRPEIAVTLDGRVTEICEKCWQIGEDERRSAVEDALDDADERRDLSDDGYDDGLADLLRDSLS